MDAKDEPVKGAELQSVIVPDGVAAPEVGKRPPWFAEQNNLAGDEELCKWAQGWINDQYEFFTGKDQRNKFRKDAKQTDNMYRMGETRDTASKQYSSTKSGVVSSSIYRTVRAIVSMEKDMFISGDELPCEFIPEINNTEFDPTTAQQMADQQNMLEQHTWEADGRRPKIHTLLENKEVVGHAVISMEWERKIEESTERYPVEFDAMSDKPTRWEWRTVKRVVKDCPTMNVHPIERCYFDASIDNTPDSGMDDHQCIIVEQEKSLLGCYAMQESGDFMNCDKIGPNLFYKDSSTDANQDLLDKTKNAGEAANIEANGLLTIWQVEALLTIKEFERKGKKTGKGKMDFSQRPARYLLTFAGPALSGKCVCLRFVRQPYFDCYSMFKIIHSLPDTKGAYHKWYAQMLQSQYWQIVTMTNQGFDCVDLASKAPWVVDGKIQSGLGKFRANSIITLARGVKLEQLNTRDITPFVIPMIEKTEDEINKCTGVEKPGLGEKIGQRASASEANNLRDQSLAILDYKNSYVADEIFPWMYRNDALLWRRCGDPSRVVLITQQNEIREISPTELYGPIKTRVTAVSRFKSNVMARQDMNSLIQNMWDRIAPIAGQEGMKVLAREMLILFKIKHVNEIIPSSGDFDARKAGMNEVQSIYQQGVMIPPLPEENHAVHLSLLEPALAEYRNLPEADRDDEKIRMFESAIQIRRNMMQAQKQGLIGGAGGPNQPPAEIQAPANTPGQVSGDMLAAQQGGNA